MRSLLELDLMSAVGLGLLSAVGLGMMTAVEVLGYCVSASDEPF